jgi:voltage-gated potassium channel
VQEKNFSWLLVALLVFLIGVPALNATELFSPRLARALIVSWLFLVGVWSLRGFGRYFNLGVGLAIAGVVLNALYIRSGASFLDFAAFAALIGFLLVAIYCALRQVVFDKEISANRLIGAISVYLMLGVLWATAYTVTELAAPGSFNGLTAEHGGAWNSGWLYFSFVTMTTLGYGDLLPVSAVARLLAYMQAVLGQFYIAILVAGLVSAYITDRQSKTADPTSAASRKNK